MSGIASSGPCAGFGSTGLPRRSSVIFPTRPGERAAHASRQAPHREREVLDRNAGQLQRHDVRARAHGDRDVRARVRELARDLSTRVADADDQHASAREARGPAILDAVHDASAKSVTAGESRHARTRDDARRHHDIPRGDVARRRPDDPARVRWLDARDVAPGLQRQLHHLDVAVQVRDEVAPRRERSARADRTTSPAARRGACRCAASGCRRGAPRMARRVAALEHHVPDPSASQLGRRRQPGRPAANDDDRISVSGRQAMRPPR